jgi:hypothetical protein
MNKKITTHPISSLASKVLSNPDASEIAKSLAASALSQSQKGNETSKEMATLASKVLGSDKYAETTKELAGSVLSQADPRR